MHFLKILSFLFYISFHTIAGLTLDENGIYWDVNVAIDDRTAQNDIPAYINNIKVKV